MRKAGDEEALITLSLSTVVRENLMGKSEELARMRLVAGAHIMSDLSTQPEPVSEPPAPTIH